MKTLNKFSALLFIAASLVTAPAAMAEHRASTTESSDVTHQQNNQEGKNFCTNLARLSDRFQGDVDGKVSDLDQKFDHEKNQVLENHDNAAKELSQDRAKWAQNRQKTYAKLSAKATTDAQKQAVTAFQTAIEAAVKARENAIDAAQTAYRQGVAQIVSQHVSTTKDVLTAYQTSIQAAIAQAKSSCAAGTDPATVRQTFMTAMESAKQSRNASKQQVDKVGPQIKVLAQTRNAAIQKAIDDYQAAVKAAVAALKAAFPEQDKNQQTTTPPTNTTTPAPTTPAPGDSTIESH